MTLAGVCFAILLVEAVVGSIFKTDLINAPQPQA